MTTIDKWENFTSTDKLNFQNCCRKLLRRTFIVRDKQEDRKHFFFIIKNIEVFLDYFAYMGFELKYDKDSGVIMLDNCAGMGDKLQSNRYRFTKEETIILCCLWLIYVSRIREGSLSAVVVVSVSDITYELEKYDAKENVNKTALEKVFKLFKNYSLVDIDGTVGEMDCKLILYPSLQFSLDTGEFERFLKEVVKVVLAEKDTIGEDTDEQSDDIE